MGKASRLQKPSRWRKNLRFVLGAGIAVYGITVFIRRDFLTYMFLQTQFVFLDFSEPVFLFYLDYLAMMGSFIFLSHFLSLALRKRTEKRRDEGGTERER